MTTPLVADPEAAADVRWQAWKARGAAGDRLRAASMVKLTALVALGLAIWFVVQIV